MKFGVPWSVKGIRPEARESVREAARRSGMSLGEWLNNVILEQAEDGRAPGHEHDDPDALGHESLGHQDLGADEHGHDDHGHDDHGDHPVESAGWVLVPLAVGLVVGLVLVALLGLESGAVPVHTL